MKTLLSPVNIIIEPFHQFICVQAVALPQGPVSPVQTQTDHEMNIVRFKKNHIVTALKGTIAVHSSDPKKLKPKGGWMVSCLRSCKMQVVESGLELSTVPELYVYLQVLMNTNPIPLLTGKGTTWFLPLGKSSLPGERRCSCIKNYNYIMFMQDVSFILTQL